MAKRGSTRGKPSDRVRARGATLRLGEAAALLGVSADTLRRWADEGRVPARRTAGGQRRVSAAALAALAASLVPESGAEHTQSLRNRFTGIVTRVVRDRVAAQVEIQAGPHRLVSLISREAADELGLRPGVVAVAAVKATNVSVELPRRAR